VGQDHQNLGGRGWLRKCDETIEDSDDIKREAGYNCGTLKINEPGRICEI
jgi:hypothetical protein